MLFNSKLLIILDHRLSLIDRYFCPAKCRVLDGVEPFDGRVDGLEKSISSNIFLPVSYLPDTEILLFNTRGQSYNLEKILKTQFSSSVETI